MVVSLLVLPLALIVVVTFASWQRDPVVVDLDWRIVAGACVAGLLTSALPAIAGAAVLATRAFPTRPTVVGALAGLGAGLMADAGWRLFCHYSEPTHVLGTHLTAVMLASIAGALLLRAMTFRRS